MIMGRRNGEFCVIVNRSGILAYIGKYWHTAFAESYKGFPT